MKKIMLLLLVGIMVCSFIACGGETSDASTPDTAVVEKTEEELKIEADNGVILPKLAAFKNLVDKIEETITTHGEADQYAEQIQELKGNYDKIEANHEEIIGLGGYTTGTDEFANIVDGEIVNLTAMLEDIKSIYAGADEKKAKVDVLLNNTNELIDVVNQISSIAEESEWFQVEEFQADLKNIYAYLDELNNSLNNTDTIDLNYIDENIEKTSESTFIWQSMLEQIQEELAN